MYQKVIVPLDGSRESERVLGSIRGLLAAESEVVLLKIIPPMTGQTLGQVVVTGSEREEAERARAMDYLRGVVHQSGGDPDRWRCDVVVSKPVAEGIINFAAQEGADLIAMFTHDRKGLARLLRGSIGSQVQQKSSIEVQLFRPRELAEVGS